MKIEFTTDGAAFCDPITQEPSKEYRAIETAVILKRIAYAVEHGCISGTVMDSNGNAVGSWNIEDNNIDVDKIASFFEQEENWNRMRNCWLQNGRSNDLRKLLCEAMK